MKTGTSNPATLAIKTALQRIGIGVDEHCIASVSGGEDFVFVMRCGDKVLISLRSPLSEQFWAHYRELEAEWRASFPTPPDEPAWIGE